jgi:hypothetical protein
VPFIFLSIILHLAELFADWLRKKKKLDTTLARTYILLNIDIQVYTYI